MSKKPIIVFEGIEGSGKSHHIKMFAKYLKRKNHTFYRSESLGEVRNSEKISKIYFEQKIKFNKNTDLLLYLASRSENIELQLRKIIRKNYFD